MNTAILQTDSTAAGAPATAEAQALEGTVRHGAPPRDAVRRDTSAAGGAAAAREAGSAVPSDSAAPAPLSDTLYVFGQGLAARNDTSAAHDFTGRQYIMGDSMLNACITDVRTGIAGDPVPYTIRGDSTITALLIGCFVVALLAFANSRRFFLMQAKHFFREPRREPAGMSETTTEVRYQMFFILQTCLLLAVEAFLYTLERVADTFILSSQYQLVAIFFGVFVGYVAAKSAVYWAVNNVFFGKKKSVRWLKSLLFAISLEGIALFPVVLLQSYFDLSIQKAVIYVTFVIVLVKIMLFYKSFVMFFKQKPFYLQIILYFCALEIMPLLSLGGILVKIVDYLKINF